MTEKSGLERKLKRLCWINEKYLNKLENSSGKVVSFYIKLKCLNNANNQMQQRNAHLREHLGQFEIFVENLQDEVMTTQ